jgi:hypothetical protein
MKETTSSKTNKRRKNMIKTMIDKTFILVN